MWCADVAYVVAIERQNNGRHYDVDFMSRLWQVAHVHVHKGPSVIKEYNLLPGKERQYSASVGGV